MDAREDWLRKRPAASEAETEAVLPLPPLLRSPASAGGDGTVGPKEVAESHL